MEINNLKVTSNFIEVIDDSSVHIELDGCIRLVHLSDTEFKTIEELQTVIINLEL